jgi:hypothetical protein
LNAYPADATIPVKLPAPYTSNFTLGFVVPIPTEPVPLTVMFGLANDAEEIPEFTVETPM